MVTSHPQSTSDTSSSSASDVRIHEGDAHSTAEIVNPKGREHGGDDGEDEDEGDGENDQLLASTNTRTRAEMTRDRSHDHDHPHDQSNRPLRASMQREFERAPPAWWKRVVLLLGIVLAGWASFKLGQWGKKEVIYAQRYSDEFRYRPAGSPIVTETLKDGRLRIRGANLGGQGVRETDIPKSPLQVEHEQKLRREEASKAAKEKLRDAREKARKRGKERKARKGK